MKKQLLLLFIIVFNSSYGQNSGIGTTSPDPSAALDIQSTTRGFAAPRMTTVQRAGIAAPAAGLMVYNTTINCYETYNGTAWMSMCCGILGESGVVRGASGKIWMAYNLGATAPASAANDFTQYGSMYQWGRTTDGHERMKYTSATAGTGLSPTNPTPVSTDTPGNVYILASSAYQDWRSPGNDNLWQGVNGINNPCPAGYRIPTKAEWDAEITIGNINNAASAFASCLKLASSGSRATVNGNYNQGGIGGYYWSSTPFVGQTIAYALVVSNSASVSNLSRSNGAAVRCIKD